MISKDDFTLIFLRNQRNNSRCNSDKNNKLFVFNNMSTMLFFFQFIIFLADVVFALSGIFRKPLKQHPGGMCFVLRECRLFIEHLYIFFVKINITGQYLILTFFTQFCFSPLWTYFVLFFLPLFVYLNMFIRKYSELEIRKRRKILFTYTTFLTVIRKNTNKRFLVKNLKNKCFVKKIKFVIITCNVTI